MKPTARPAPVGCSEKCRGNTPPISHQKWSVSLRLPSASTADGFAALASDGLLDRGPTPLRFALQGGRCAVNCTFGSTANFEFVVRPEFYSTHKPNLDIS